MTRNEAAFSDWRDRADEVDLLATAVRLGAKLKRAGQEHVGPCPVCLGTDRFSINPGKRKWNCRGAEGGGGAISLAMHAGSMTFLQAGEWLTGEPNPSGREARQLTDDERREMEQRRAAAEAAQAAREAQEQSKRAETREDAETIWNASVGLAGTLGETHLRGRGIVGAGWPPSLRFHPNCPLGEWSTAPAIVARVDDLDGTLCAVWRIFLRTNGMNLADGDGKKLKLGLGPAGGGAVRLGGIAPKIGIAEGVETALGAALLTGCRFPVWAALSTAGMIGLEVPLGVEHVTIFPDGDAPIRKKGDSYEPAVPAGRKAAVALRERLLREGVGVTIAAEPPEKSDYLDLWNMARGEVA
jgi:hypothetical protein